MAVHRFRAVEDVAADFAGDTPTDQRVSFGQHVGHRPGDGVIRDVIQIGIVVDDW
jgi:hypothetical protein